MNYLSTHTALVGVLSLGLISGCSELSKPPVAAEAEKNNNHASLLRQPDEMIVSLKIGKNGDIQPVDADGNPLQPCKLPDSTVPVQGGADPTPECSKSRNTSIREIRSMAIIIHSGSTCITYGGGIVGGKVMPTYQICYP